MWKLHAATIQEDFSALTIHHSGGAQIKELSNLVGHKTWLDCGTQAWGSTPLTYMDTERREEEVIWEDSMGLSWTHGNLMKSLKGRCKG